LIMKFDFSQQEKNPRAEGTASIYVDHEEIENRR
jgi:DNA-dependent RNA polymerase auxiliary subunit epsilon